MHDAQNEKATFSLRGGYIAAFFIGVFSLLVAVWAAHPEADRPTSVTTIGLSRPGVGAGIYNGLRAKSIPAVTELSRLEQQASEPQPFSVRGADLIQ